MIRKMEKLVEIADLYNASLTLDSLNEATIRYQELGQGSAISTMLEDAYPAIKIKMIPSEQILKVEVLDY